MLKIAKLADKEAERIVSDEVNGCFLEDMTENEMADWLKDNELGWGKFKNKLKDILK
jgi:hypothetical protein